MIDQFSPTQQKLGWPKSSFTFFRNILWKKPKPYLLSNLIYTRSHETLTLVSTPLNALFLQCFFFYFHSSQCTLKLSPPTCGVKVKIVFRMSQSFEVPRTPMCLQGLPLSFILLLHPDIELRNGQGIFPNPISKHFCNSLHFLIERTKLCVSKLVYMSYTGPY